MCECLPNWESLVCVTVEVVTQLQQGWKWLWHFKRWMSMYQRVMVSILQSSLTVHLQNALMWIHMSIRKPVGLFTYIQLIICCFYKWKLMMILYYLCKASFHFKNVVFFFCLLFLKALLLGCGWQFLFVDVVSLNFYHFVMFNLKKKNHKPKKPTNHQNQTKKTPHQKTPQNPQTHLPAIKISFCASPLFNNDVSPEKNSFPCVILMHRLFY